MQERKKLPPESQSKKCGKPMKAVGKGLISKTMKSSAPESEGGMQMRQKNFEEPLT